MQNAGMKPVRHKNTKQGSDAEATHAGLESGVLGAEEQGGSFGVSSSWK